MIQLTFLYHVIWRERK